MLEGVIRVLKSVPKTSKKGTPYFLVSFISGDTVVKGMSEVDLSGYFEKQVPVELEVRDAFGGKGGLELKVLKIIKE